MGIRDLPTSLRGFRGDFFNVPDDFHPSIEHARKWIKAESNRRLDRARDEESLVEFTELDKRFHLLAVLRSEDHPSRRLAIGSLRDGVSFVDVAQRLFGKCKIYIFFFVSFLIILFVTEEACRLVGVGVLGQHADVHQVVPDRIAGDAIRREIQRGYFGEYSDKK